MINHSTPIVSFSSCLSNVGAFLRRASWTTHHHVVVVVLSCFLSLMHIISCYVSCTECARILLVLVRLTQNAKSHQESTVVVGGGGGNKRQTAQKKRE